ncbi:MAG: PHP domain-containing protein [Bacteroidales bacterium]
MEKIYRTDYHVHTTFSDGKAAAPDYIEAAVVAGLSEIGFSEHLNLLWKDQPYGMPSERTGEYILTLKN